MRSLALSLVRAPLAALTLALLASTSTSAQSTTPSTAAAVPQSHIPSTLLLEVRGIERQFDAMLVKDCAPEFCTSKGCAYVSHLSVDNVQGGSLPGLGQNDGIGSVPVQEYLTEARCEFTYEPKVQQKDVKALTRRLEQGLSRAWLKVTVAGQSLEPISDSLSKSPEQKPEKPEAKPEPKPEEEEPKKPEPPPEWNADVALQQLWATLLPHFSWMIAIFLLSIAVLAFIWAGRRLGTESIEEKMLEAQIDNTTPEEATSSEAEDKLAAAEAKAAEEAAAAAKALEEDPTFIAEQIKLWSARIDDQDNVSGETTVAHLLRQWLRANEFELLAKAVFIFGDKLSPAFSADPELAVKKMEFAEFLQAVDEEKLPTRTEFFRRLNHHAVSSNLLASDDVQIYRSLNEEFGAAGLSDLMGRLSPRHGALLFALLPMELQVDVAPVLPADLRVSVASQLLASTRISREETRYIFDVLRAARDGKEIPDEPEGDRIADRGREIDAAIALSMLMPFIDAKRRQELFARAIQRTRGAHQRWYEGIVYGDMLLTVPDEQRKDLLLDVDVRALAAWLSLQDPAWTQPFMQTLAPSMQSALKASLHFETRAEQLRLARKGHNELVAAVKRATSRGRLAFGNMIA